MITFEQLADRLVAAMMERDETDDPFKQEILSEEIRQLKKSLLPIIPQFKGMEVSVAGDKDADEAQFVVCADANPGVYRCKGTVEVPCSMCKTTILLSPDSPTKQPKICIRCAIKEAEQNNLERDQDSLGA